jgi:trehalose-6-phosphatase
MNLATKEFVAARDLAQPLKAIGVEVEDKRYSLTFHYRESSEPSGAPVAPRSTDTGPLLHLRQGVREHDAA